MREKSLLYGALGFTALAAAIGVYKAKSSGDRPEVTITPVSPTDSSRAVTAADVPVRLTASDGTGLKLVSLRAEAAVEDPLALTELHLTFENPEDRVLEGTFRITLPQGASLSRFAMKVGSAWQEGEVVEKQAARQAYEDFLHRKQDPALMEQGAGNEFSARVFPIPARGTKEIIVTYAEAVELGAAYVLPLRGLPQLGALDVNVHVAGQTAAANGGKTDAVYGLHQQRFTPAADFVVDAKQLPRSPGLRSGDLAIARIVPFASSRPEPVGSALVLVDTSASRGLGIAEQARALQSMLSKLPPDTMLSVACFDQDVAPVYDGKAGDFGDKEVQAIVARGALGASDFEQALDYAAVAAKKSKARRVILVTDGVATAGETDAQKLRSKVEALRGSGVGRMDAVATGGIRDDGFLRTVTRGVLDRDGVVLDAKLGADAVARRLGEATSSGIEVKVEGARWSWPDRLDGLQAGDEVLVYAELPGAGPVKIDVSGQRFTPDVRTIDRPLVERAWAQAKIQSLIESPRSSPQATKQEIVALSTRHRVLSPHTALLVLETDADYRRFGIDRTAKLDILTVRDGNVAITDSPRGWEEERNKELRPTPPSWTGTLGKRKADTSRSESAPAAAPTTAAAPNGAPGDPLADAPRDPSPARDQDDGDGFANTRGLAGKGGGGPDLGSLGQGQAAPAAPAPAPPPPPPREVPAAEPQEAPKPVARPRPATEAAPHASARGGPQNPADEGHAGGPSGHSDREDEAASTGTVRPGVLNVEQGIAPDEVQRVVRGAMPRFRTCYQAELGRNQGTNGRLTIRFAVGSGGDVTSASVTSSPSGATATLSSCMESVAKSLRFPALGAGEARFSQSFELVGGSDTSPSSPANVARTTGYEGRFKIVMDALGRGEKDAAFIEAHRWHDEQPGDVLALVALGEVFEAKGDLRSAARAYGSILELFSFRADSRRFAGERLERLADPRAALLAIDTYKKAVEQRPDHPAGHRLYAFALLKKGDHERAFDAIKKGAARSYPSGRFLGVDRILKEDMGLVAAAWIHAQPERAPEIRAKLSEAGGALESGPSLRFVLNWETDANDVDFHIHDGKGGHAYYSQKQLPSGGELYADVTTGYGPECFTIRGPRDARAYPYTLQAHYYSRGPMGYGMGKLQVLEHDGSGRISFEERPFVVMVDRAYVDLGGVDKATKLAAAMR